MAKKKTKKDLKKVLRVVGAALLLLVWVAASVIVSQLIVGYIMVFFLGAERFSTTIWETVFSALSYLLALLLIILVPYYLSKNERFKRFNLATNKTELGIIGLPTWKDIGLSLAGFVIYLLIASGLVALFSLFPWFNAEQTQDLIFSPFIVGFDRILAYLILVIVAPVIEELIFRGWLYGKLKKLFKGHISEVWSTILSIFLTSLLFGLVHFQWNVGVNVFAMSLILCGLRELTGTIYAGIILHMIKNGLAFFLIFVLGIR